MNKDNLILKITTNGLLLALGWLLPMFTGQIQLFGNMLCPMHIPVMIGGILLGWQSGLFLGIVIPLTRSLMFGMPVMYPNAVGMAFELATYGVVTGVAFRLLRKTKLHIILQVVLALLPAMIIGRGVWGLTRWIFTLISTDLKFSFKMFLTGAFVTAWPGIIVQFALIPYLVFVLSKTNTGKRFLEEKKIVPEEESIVDNDEEK